MNLADEFVGWVTATILANEPQFKWIVEPRNYLGDGKRSGPPTLRFVLKTAFAQWYEYRRQCGLPRMAYEQFVPLWMSQEYVLKVQHMGMGKGRAYSLARLCDVDLLLAQEMGVEVVT